MNHEHFMHHCLQLAQKGRGMVGGNPMVGSVLVRDGEVIAEGWYQGKGSDHAERMVLDAVSTSDILYVNLEPCCHTGNTPPCTDAIIKTGITTVVYGMQDPDARVAGQGIEQLIDNGITVIGPVLRVQCERLNRGYISLRTKNRPYITLKRAQTRDGKVANTDGTKLCITSQEQNTWSHTHLRSTHDAILVGVQTVVTDDPLLTTRNTNCKLQIANCNPIRIILDPNLRIPLEAKVVGEGTIIVKEAKEAKEDKEAKEEKLKEKGCTVLSIPVINNHFDWNALWEILSTLNSQLSTILVEGGPKTWEAFKASNLIDEEVILID